MKAYYYQEGFLASAKEADCYLTGNALNSGEELAWTKLVASGDKPKTGFLHLSRANP
jgi:hypothetical protein